MDRNNRTEDLNTRDEIDLIELAGVLWRKILVLFALGRPLRNVRNHSNRFTAADPAECPFSGVRLHTYSLPAAPGRLSGEALINAIEEFLKLSWDKKRASL
ncbi:MAG: hypothetical protein IIZ51_06575 [Lachnospiraceae bacterium]|nr:hypothetical protein [Lachnospiraceae bacterium]